MTCRSVSLAFSVQFNVKSLESWPALSQLGPSLTGVIYFRLFKYTQQHLS